MYDLYVSAVCLSPLMPAFLCSALSSSPLPHFSALKALKRSFFFVFSIDVDWSYLLVLVLLLSLPFSFLVNFGLECPSYSAASHQPSPQTVLFCCLLRRLQSLLRTSILICCNFLLIMEYYFFLDKELWSTSRRNRQQARCFCLYDYDTNQSCVVFFFW